MRWPWQRRRSPPPPTPFDASIDVDVAPLAPTERQAALEAVRESVRALPGAGWISVEPHAASEVRVFPAGSSVEGEGEVWTALRSMIEAAVCAVLPDPDAWDPRPAVARGGFAEPQGFGEAISPAQLEALADLAALAGALRAPEPVLPPAPTGGIDVERMTGLLGFVLPVDGRETAAAAVAHFGSFAAVLAAPEAELRRVRGLGTHSIAAIKLVHAAAVRLARAQVAAQPVLDDPKRLADYLAAALARERVEQFRILFLDANGMLLADEVQASGTVNHTPVYPREVVRRALALGAAAVVLVHNHPSGDPQPSRDDIEMTRQVRAAAAVMAVEVRDHVIIGNGRSLSFRQSGLLT